MNGCVWLVKWGPGEGCRVIWRIEINDVTSSNWEPYSGEGCGTGECRCLLHVWSWCGWCHLVMVVVVVASDRPGVGG